MSGLEPDRHELHAPPPYRLALSRRELGRALGGGLVVVLLHPGAAAQESGRGGRERAPGELAAWLHIAADGTVTVYTGKVEVGQDARTSLTQAIADELPAPLASIHLVMGDTALTPFDAGTFGSRTTPAMAPRLRKVAACARERLRALAAAALKIDGAKLVLAEGSVTDPTSGRSLKFGALTGGQKLVATVSDDVAITPAPRWKVAGQPLPRVDARAVVTGQRRYTPDLKRPGLLLGKIARPPRFGASVASVDDRAAGQIAGVRVVRDGELLGVVAPDEERAGRALEALRIEWTTPKEPAPSWQDLFQRLRAAGGERAPEHEQGDATAAHARAKQRLEQSYTTAYIAHVPLEPRAAVAEWRGDYLTVWTGTQRPFGVRRELADALRLPEAQIQVVVPDTGAAYGGKHTGEVAVEAARLARAAGKPVKLLWTREEEFTWAYFRPAALIDLRSAIGADGKVVAWQAHNFNAGTAGLRTPYAIPNQRHVYHPATAPLRQGSYRALAATANNFARETHMDELAQLRGADPLAFRLDHLSDQRLRAVLAAAAERFRWGSGRSGGGLGFGLACGAEKGGYVATCAEVGVDGTVIRVVRLVTAFECGAVVNPDGLRNQIEGAAIMGLGGALFEAIEFADGQVLNPRLSQYRVPRFRDVPRLETVLVDRKDLPSAGAGECPIIAVAPAIGNAVCAATGKRLRDLPLTLG
jgi:isoquinoline 1-oxidoreductase